MNFHILLDTIFGSIKREDDVLHYALYLTLTIAVVSLGIAVSVSQTSKARAAHGLITVIAGIHVILSFLVLQGMKTMIITQNIPTRFIDNVAFCVVASCVYALLVFVMFVKTFTQVPLTDVDERHTRTWRKPPPSAVSLDQLTDTRRKSETGLAMFTLHGVGNTRVGSADEGGDERDIPTTMFDPQAAAKLRDGPPSSNTPPASS